MQYKGVKGGKRQSCAAHLLAVSLELVLDSLYETESIEHPVVYHPRGDVPSEVPLAGERELASVRRDGRNSHEPSRGSPNDFRGRLVRR